MSINMFSIFHSRQISCWWPPTIILWRVTLSKLCRRGGPKSGGNCKYTTFPGTHAPNRSGQQESFRRGETRPQFHCLVHLLPAYWTPALPALLEFAILDFLSWHFYSGMFFFWTILFWNCDFWHLWSSALRHFHVNFRHFRKPPN